jgi:hypothetical protein
MIMEIHSQPAGLAWQLLTDESVYKARKEAQNAVLDILNHCAGKLKKSAADFTWLPSEARESLPKISRGENYKGNPWIVLDYPRIFEKESVFAFRTMAWFGNAMHCTFHMSGRFLNDYRESIMRNLHGFHDSSIMICRHQDAWLHHISHDAFIPLNQVNINDLKEMKFIKPGAVIPFNEWEMIPEKVNAVFTQISSLLNR